MCGVCVWLCVFIVCVRVLCRYVCVRFGVCDCVYGMVRCVWGVCVWCLCVSYFVCVVCVFDMVCI